MYERLGFGDLRQALAAPLHSPYLLTHSERMVLLKYHPDQEMFQQYVRDILKNPSTETNWRIWWVGGSAGQPDLSVYCARDSEKPSESFLPKPEAHVVRERGGFCYHVALFPNKVVEHVYRQVAPDPDEDLYQYFRLLDFSGVRGEEARQVRDAMHESLLDLFWEQMEEDFRRSESG